MRRREKIVFIVAVVLAVVGLLTAVFFISFLGKIYMTQEGNQFTFESVDGPTAVFLAGKLGDSDDGLRLKEQNDNNAGVSHLPLGMYMTVIDYNDGIVTVQISNQSGYQMIYGEEYSLQKLVDGKWQDMQPVEDYGWNDIANVIEDLEEVVVCYDLQVFGKLEPGEYRLCKTDLYAEFTLIEK